jgi:hypothetical protein
MDFFRQKAGDVHCVFFVEIIHSPKAIQRDYGNMNRFPFLIQATIRGPIQWKSMGACNILFIVPGVVLPPDNNTKVPAASKEASGVKPLTLVLTHSTGGE